MPDPAGGQRRDLVVKPNRSLSLLKDVPDWLPPQIAIDDWWRQNGLDHEETRHLRNELYKITQRRAK